MARSFWLHRCCGAKSRILATCSRPSIEHDVDAAERLASRERLDDGDAVDPMRERAVRMTGGDDVHQPLRQAPRDLKNLRVVVARRQVFGIVEPVAASARMRGDDHDFGAGRSKLRGLGRDRRARRRHAQSLHVGGDGRPQRIDRHDADDADGDAGRLDDHRRPDVRPVHEATRRFVDQVRREEGISGLGRARLERAAEVARRLSRRRRVDGSEVEIVVADGLRGVPHRVVRVDDEGAFAEIRFDVALKRVARVDQQNRSAVRRARRPQIVHVSGEQRQTTETVCRKRGPVKIAGADNRQRQERGLVRRRRRALGRASRRPATAASPRSGRARPV